MLFCLRIISTISKGLVGRTELPSSVLVELSISNFPNNPFEIVEMIRRQNSMNDATDPSDAIDDALRSFNSLEEK